MSYGSVTQSPDWGGDVFLVGGGPSARTFDYRLLLNQKVLAINDMCSRLCSSPCGGPLAFFQPPAFFTEDRRWVRRNRTWLTSYPGEKYVSLPLETWPDCGGIPDVTYLRSDHGNEGLSLNPGTINSGGNSGFGAINLAMLKGAKRIFLIGYDMDPAANVLYEQWMPRFRSAMPQLRALGVEVHNLNPDSHIDAFPKSEISRFKLSESLGDRFPRLEGLRTSLGPGNSQETGFYGAAESPEAPEGRI